MGIAGPLVSFNVIPERRIPHMDTGIRRSNENLQKFENPFEYPRKPSADARNESPR